MMKTILTQGLDSDEKSLFRQEFAGSTFMRKRLTDILTKKINSYQADMRSKHNYDKTNWAYDQADSIGYIRAMNELVSLLEK